MIKNSRNVSNLPLLMASHQSRRVLHRPTMVRLYPSMRGSLNRLTALMLIFLLTMMAGLITY